MAAILKLSRIIPHTHYRRDLPCVIIVRHAGMKHIKTYSMDDWRPDEYPVTEAQRIAAAKRYGMRLEDYKPFAPTSTWGDYPDVPGHYCSDRLGHYDFDFQYWKRDYGDPVPIQMDKYRGFIFDPTYDDQIAYHKINSRHKRLLVALGITSLYFFYSYYLHPRHFDIIGPSVAEKMYPTEGQTHYLFCKKNDFVDYADDDHSVPYSKRGISDIYREDRNPFVYYK